MLSLVDLTSGGAQIRWLAARPELVADNAEELGEVQLARARERLDLGALLRTGGEMETPNSHPKCDQPLPREHIEEGFSRKRRSPSLAVS